MRRIVIAAMLLTGAPAVAQNVLMTPAFYPVTGAPFRLVVETTWDGTLSAQPGRTLDRVVRDGAGRQRFETPAVEEAAANGEAARILIVDLVSEKIIRLDTLKRTATVSRMTQVGHKVTIDPAARRGFPCHAAQGWTALGVRQVAGFETCGQKNATRELWLSTQYLMPLLSVTENRDLGHVTQQVTQLEAGEPDASLFAVPPGYTVIAPSPLRVSLQ